MVNSYLDNTPIYFFFHLFGMVIRVKEVFRKTLKMSTVEVVETSVANNSLSRDYLHPDDHTKQITDTPGFKPFPAPIYSYSHQSLSLT